MAIYKNDNGTWYVMIRYQDWTGARKQKCKRGFSTRKEAADWELQFKLQKKASVDMTMESFCTMYEEDVRPSLKQSTWLTKENIIQKKILPYLGKRKVSEITATLPKNFYEYSIKNHSFFQRENKEDLMENKRTETNKTVQKRLEPELKLINMDTVEVEQIEWLLYPFIPYGKVTIIQGDPGEGKTTMVLQIIAKLTRGETILPADSTKDKRIDIDSESDMVDAENIENNASTQHLEAPVNVIYQTAEDGLGDTIKPRLLAAGADCTKVMVIDDSEQPLTMADVRLEEAIVQTKARMVVLDPIQGFLGSEVDMHRANEIRPLMKRIAVLAEKYHCAIILIGHMNKNSNGKSSYRGLGSIDFQAAARSVLIVGRIKDEPEVRVVCHTKSSLAPEGKAIAFRLDKNNGFEWIGEYDISADELLNGEGKGQKTRKAKEFLLEILADGGMAQKKIEEEAEKMGIKKKTLRNAKMELGIDSIKRGNQWYWMLSE